MEHWERRERKLQKRRKAMRMAGAGLKKVILPLLQKKAEVAEERSAEKIRRPKLSPIFLSVSYLPVVQVSH